MTMAAHVHPFVNRRDAIARAAAGELLGPADIQAIFAIRKSRYYELEAEHAFDQFRVHPPIGPKCFSGSLITEYLKGKPVYSTAAQRSRR
jgi:hypothetical protein